MDARTRRSHEHGMVRDGRVIVMSPDLPTFPTTVAMNLRRRAARREQLAARTQDARQSRDSSPRGTRTRLGDAGGLLSQRSGGICVLAGNCQVAVNLVLGRSLASIPLAETKLSCPVDDRSGGRRRRSANLCRHSAAAGPKIPRLGARRDDRLRRGGWRCHGCWALARWPAYGRWCWRRGWRCSWLRFAAPFAASLFGSAPWWGTRLIVVGSGELAARTHADLAREPQWGLRPVGFIDERRCPTELPIRHTFWAPSTPGRLAAEFNVDWALAAVHSFDADELAELLSRTGGRIKHWIILPPLERFPSLWLEACEAARRPALTITNRLRNGWSLPLKRALDLAVGDRRSAWPFLPLIGLIAVLDSPRLARARFLRPGADRPIWPALQGVEVPHDASRRRCRARPISRRASRAGR